MVGLTKYSPKPTWLHWILQQLNQDLVPGSWIGFYQIATRCSVQISDKGHGSHSQNPKSSLIQRKARGVQGTYQDTSCHCTACTPPWDPGKSLHRRRGRSTPGHVSECRLHTWRCSCPTLPRPATSHPLETKKKRGKIIKTACYVPNIICNRRNRDPKVSRGALVSRVGFGRKGGFLFWILYLILNIKSVFPFPSHQSKGDFVFLLSTSTPCKSNPISFLRLKFGAVLLNTFPMGRDLTGQSHLPGQVYTWSPLGMYNACVKIPSQGRSGSGVQRDQQSPQQKTMKRHQIKLTPDVSIALMLHVPWKEVWDDVSFHCAFSQHLSNVEM